MTRATLILALAAGAAQAQSFNIDIDTTSGPGLGIPGQGIAGPSGIVGHWNSITSASPAVVPLVLLNGNASGVSLTRATNGSFAGTNNAATTLAYESLLDDYQYTVDQPLVYTFNNLSSGFYAVYVCGADPASQYNLSTIAVTGADPDSQPTQPIGGPIPSNRYIAGVTHSVHFKQVTDGHLTITISAGFLTRGLISGLQIVRLPDPSWRIRLYVNDDATGTDDGAGWLSAFRDLQSALATARLGGGSHFEAWAAAGFYEPTQGADRAATFDIPSGLRLFGGFAGTESTLAQRTAPLAHLTYLSGAIGSSAATDNSYTVVTMAYCNDATTIDGFFVARGYNNDNGFGGGMRLVSCGSPLIRNCDFTTNEADRGGAGLYSNNSSPRIINCTFYRGLVSGGNSGGGGGLEATGPTGLVTVQNCRFLGNAGEGGGGAVNTSAISADFADCLFTGNTSGFRGGAVYAYGTTQALTLRNCTFSKNSAADLCGGVYMSSVMSLALYNCAFWGNTAAGGGTLRDQQFYVIPTSLTIANTTVQGVDPNPLFVNALGADGIAGTFDDDCRLQASSPCIDAADSARLPADVGDVDGDGDTSEALPLDLLNLPRRLDNPAVPNTGPGALDRGCYEFQVAITCYANCDGSSSAPALNILDFTCFLNKFAAGDAYANCDGSITPPVLNILDFTCFLNQFAAGCP